MDEYHIKYIESVNEAGLVVQFDAVHAVRSVSVEGASYLADALNDVVGDLKSISVGEV